MEGIGDHGCEYMTGGLVVVLGDTGKNFAAGMSGGIAYIYNPEGRFEERVNRGMIDLDPMDTEDVSRLHALIAKHQNLTGSARAKALLADWDNAQQHFTKVMPRDYKRVLEARKATAGVAEHSTVVQGKAAV